MAYFTQEELLSSSTALRLHMDNTPTEEHLRNLEEMRLEMLEPMREGWAHYCSHHHLGTPKLRVTSGYRSEALNREVGGSSTSAHAHGWAVDLQAMNGQMLHFKRFAKEWFRTHPFDQLISEGEDASGTPRWLHIGYKRPLTHLQRHMMLSMQQGHYLPMT